jgi:hypothetical protein
MRIIGILAAVFSTLLLAGCSGGNGDTSASSANDSQPATEQAAPGVFILSPADGATVTSPLTVTFGISEYVVAPAGTQEPNTGHHHLLVDTDLPALDQPIPSDDNHIHFGKGQTETTLELAPGSHTLRLLLGDGSHVPHNPPLVSESITITVSN